MISKIAISNFRCLADFRIEPEREQLFLGANGAGKSAVFDVVERLVALATGEGDATELFPKESRTRWLDAPTQTFELDLPTDRGVFGYRLVLDHDQTLRRVGISTETVLLSDRILFESRSGKGRTFVEDGSLGTEVLVHPNRSSVPALALLAENANLVEFARRMNRIIVLRPDPHTICGRDSAVSHRPVADLSNFTAWYRQLVQERSDSISKLHEQLRNYLPGFQNLRFVPGGRERVVTQWRGPEDEPIDYGFEELSDGQRLIIALNAVLFWLGEEQATICLDEPDNFLALTEIQPLLWLLRERESVQALLISHHPEIIDDLARTKGIILDRPNRGNVRARPFTAPGDTELTASELVIRGDVGDEHG